MPPHNVLAEWIEVPPPAPRYARVGLRASFARLDPASGRDVRECGCCRANMASPSRGMNCPRFAGELPARFVRGRREDRVLAAPAVSRAICANKTAHEHTGQREHSGLPCAMAYGLLRALPGERLFCLRYRRNTSRQRSASTAAPEPHDFAVRSSCTRQSQLLRPPHLTARS
jgi:hypothetical protein